MGASRSRGRGRRGRQQCVRFVVPQLEPLEVRFAPAGLVVQDLTTETATDLVNQLVGTGVSVSNVKYTGTNLSSGSFTGGTGIVGFESGIVLSTGHAKDIVGPNKSESTSSDNGTPGDAALTAIVGAPTFDADVLEFDFVPQGSTLTFKYVFSSEEYNEFVGSQFADVFAFFVNGTNVALLPGTNTPVDINTVNLQTNSQFYINNGLIFDPTTNPLNFEMDGLTTVLPITVTVNPGVTNHMRLAIADTSDAIYDSNVLIEAGSLSAPPPPVSPVYKTYHPLRYLYDSASNTFDGNITILNISTALNTLPANSPIFVEFPQLPPGVTLVNATGVDPNTHAPFIEVNLPSALPANVPLRVPIKLSDPLNVPLSTFYVGFPVVVFNS